VLPALARERASASVHCWEVVAVCGQLVGEVAGTTGIGVEDCPRCGWWRRNETQAECCYEERGDTGGDDAPKRAGFWASRTDCLTAPG
jgi:hypothetical protein